MHRPYSYNHGILVTYTSSLCGHLIVLLMYKLFMAGILSSFKPQPRYFYSFWYKNDELPHSIKAKKTTLKVILKSRTI